MELLYHNPNNFGVELKDADLDVTLDRGRIDVVENWAPREELPPQPRDNPWARAHGLPTVASVHTRFETYPRYYGLAFLEPLILPPRWPYSRRSWCIRFPKLWLS